MKNEAQRRTLNTHRSPESRKTRKHIHHSSSIPVPIPIHSSSLSSSHSSCYYVGLIISSATIQQVPRRHPATVIATKSPTVSKTQPHTAQKKSRKDEHEKWHNNSLYGSNKNVWHSKHSRAAIHYQVYHPYQLSIEKQVINLKSICDLPSNEQHTGSAVATVGHHL